MAEFKTTVALEIGAQSVTMGVFVPSGKGFALSRYARRDIVLDPVEEGMRMDYVSNAIAELVAELGVKGSAVRNVVSGQQIVLRFIKLPILDMNDAHEQVGYEAQQHIPFPLSEIVYSYHMLGESDSGEQEVLLVAMKKVVLDELNAQVEGSGLRTQSVDCSSSALYNAYRIGYNDGENSVMIIDIGAKTTDIIFSENGRFFTRSVTAAGAYITNAIARDQGIPFRQAEALKLSQGMISMGNGHTDNMEETQAALATTIRTAMGRLSSEVHRTINHYRGQYNGNAPVKAYICGGGARMPFATEFLQAALDIPVEFLNPLAAFSIGAKIDEDMLAMDALCLGPIAGAAVSGANLAEIKIDLVPTSVGKNRAENALIPKIITAGVIALAGAALFAWTGMNNDKDAQASLAKAQRSYDRVEGIARGIGNIENRYRDADKKLAVLAELYKAQTSYIDLLQQLGEGSSSIKFWLTEFTPLINYDVNTNVLESGKDVKATSLINMKDSRSSSSSAINAAPENAELSPRNRKEEAKVTVILVKGYIIKNSVNKDDTQHRDTVRNLVRDKFEQSKENSIFAFKLDEVEANMNRYFQFTGSEASRGRVPSYVEEFSMIMPLKNAIDIPSLQRNK